MGRKVIHKSEGLLLTLAGSKWKKIGNSVLQIEKRKGKDGKGFFIACYDEDGYELHTIQIFKSFAMGSKHNVVYWNGMKNKWGFKVISTHETERIKFLVDRCSRKSKEGPDGKAARRKDDEDVELYSKKKKSKKRKKGDKVPSVTIEDVQGMAFSFSTQSNVESQAQGPESKDSSTTSQSTTDSSSTQEKNSAMRMSQSAAILPSVRASTSSIVPPINMSGTLKIAPPPGPPPSESSTRSAPAKGAIKPPPIIVRTASDGTSGSLVNNPAVIEKMKRIEEMIAALHLEFSELREMVYGKDSNH